MDNFSEAYLTSQFEELRENDRARTRQADQYIARLWSQYRTLLMFTTGLILLAVCCVIYHQFSLYNQNRILNRIGDLERKIDNIRYQELQEKIDQKTYEEECIGFIGFQRCKRMVNPN